MVTWFRRKVKGFRASPSHPDGRVAGQFQFLRRHPSNNDRVVSSCVLLLPSSPFVGFLLERAAPIALVSLDRERSGRYLTAPHDDKDILEQCLNIPQSQGCHPSL